VVFELADGQHEAGEGGEVVAFFGDEAHLADAFFLAGGVAAEKEEEAQDAGFEREHVVLDADGYAGVVEGGIGGEGALGEGAGLLGEFERGEVFFVDHGGVVGVHAGDDGAGVESAGVIGILAESDGGEGFGLGYALFEGAADGFVGGRALAAGEAVFVGEELDVEDAEAVELREEEGGGIGCGAERVVGMGGSPVFEDVVGAGEVEVVHVEVALVQAGVQERLGGKRCAEHQEGGGEDAGETDREPPDYDCLDRWMRKPVVAARTIFGLVDYAVECASMNMERDLFAEQMPIATRMWEWSRLIVISFREAFMRIGLGVFVAMMAVSGAAYAADFDRTLTVPAQADVYVSTGSGRIHIYPGSDNEVHIKAHIHAGWNAGGDIDERMRKISANPPITQSGKEVHVGEVPSDRRELYRNISIDYEISAPKSVALNLHTGSGDVEVDNLGRSLKAETGSGSVRAHQIAGPAEMHTGSGDIELQQSAAGEVKAQTGSGSIRINGLDGALTARTGSGDIEANGTLVGPSRLQTGSGSIRAHIGKDAKFTVDASSGSGTIRVAGLTGARHRLSGPINGGGPELEAHTGSGDIEIN